jgi:hypothetical protein
VDIEFFGIVPGVGTVIANENTMHVAKNLLEEIESFGRRNPGHQKSVDSLTTAVKRIDNEFSGKARETLLTEARKTFLQQIRNLESNERTVDALEKLQSNQAALVATLNRLTVKQAQRCEGETIH